MFKSIIVLFLLDCGWNMLENIIWQSWKLSEFQTKTTQYFPLHWLDSQSILWFLSSAFLAQVVSFIAQFVKNPPAIQETWVQSELGRSLGERKGYPLQYSGLENSIDCIVHGVAKSRTWLSNFHLLVRGFRAGFMQKTALKFALGMQTFKRKNYQVLGS